MARKQAKRRKLAERPAFKMPRIPFARIGACLLAAGVVAVGYHFGTSLLDRPITAITIDGPFQRVSALQIEEAISAELEQGFLSADLGDIQDRLTALPWIDRANVVRRWPGQLEISVSEQVPAACWGERGLLNVRGELFVTDARHIPAELPRLSGPEGYSDEVAKRYLQIREQLIPRGLDVRRLHLDARGAWDMTLQNGIEIRLGRRDVGTRTQLFLDVVADVITRRGKEIEFVDMRYSNGFTIGWNGESATPAAAPEESGPALLAGRNE
jgi:cell division protein FtsQ